MQTPTSTDTRNQRPFGPSEVDPWWLDVRESAAWFSSAARDEKGPWQRWRHFASRWQLGPNKDLDGAI